MKYNSDFDYEELETLDDNERSYYDSVMAEGDPDEIQQMREYFGWD